MADVELDSRDLPLQLGDAAPLVSGARLAAQNIIETIYTPVGSLPWDREAGSYLFQMLNDLVGPETIQAELRRVAINAAGVVPSTVQVGYDEDRDRYSVTFQGASEPLEVVTVSADADAIGGGPIPPNVLRIGSTYLLLAPGVPLRV